MICDVCGEQKDDIKDIETDPYLSFKICKACREKFGVEE